MKFDKINEKKAELIGAIIGDGCIRYKPDINQYYIEIVGNPKEEVEYFNHLKSIIKKEFGLISYIKVRERGLRLKVYSKELIVDLVNRYNLPYNKEKGRNIFIPKEIINHPKLLKCCLRGIVDTDGSLFLSKKSHRADYPTIEISTTSKKLAEQLRNLLSRYFRIGFRTYKPKNFLLLYVISINGETMVDMWVKDIGFSNLRNIKRYRKLKGGAGGTFKS